MAGTQIRWASLGRVAAIGAAVIAGIAALPALLGSDAPPPVPADVGLAGPPMAADPRYPQPAAAAVPPKAAPVLKPPAEEARTPKKHRMNRATKAKDRQRRGARGHADRRRPAFAEQSPAPVYVPAPSYSPPLSSGEFRFER